jgi:hypothetical protein
VQVTPASIEEHFERRRIARERYIAANPEIETEIAALYQGKTVPRVQPDSLAGFTQAVRGNAGNGRGQNAMTMSKSVTLCSNGSSMLGFLFTTDHSQLALPPRRFGRQQSRGPCATHSRTVAFEVFGPRF